MKHLLLTTIAAVVLVGCSDPEAEANKLFTEASRLVKEADAIEGQDSLEAFKKRKLAVELLDNIPAQYPQSSLSVEISKGGFKIHGQSIAQIREKMKPDISIHDAAKQGNIEIVKQHIATGTDVNARAYSTFEDAAPLHVAASSGKKEIAELLISSGADVNALGDRGTPLDVVRDEVYREVVRGNETYFTLENAGIAELLRKHGGKSGAGDSIHVAVMTGNIEAVKKHLTAGTNVNAKDNSERTPLHIAAWKGHKKIAELLISEGADVNAKSDIGYTPLDTAIFDKKTEIADLLRKHGAKTDFD